MLRRIGKAFIYIDARLNALVHRLDVKIPNRFGFEIRAVVEGLVHGNGEVVTAKMTSGKKGRYIVTSDVVHTQDKEYQGLTDSIERNWNFKFVGYAN